MPEPITKDDLQHAIEQFVTRVDELEGSIDQSFQTAYDILDQHEEQTEKLAALIKSELEDRDERFDRIDEQLKALGAPTARLRAVELRLDKLERRDAAA